MKVLKFLSFFLSVFFMFLYGLDVYSSRDITCSYSWKWYDRDDGLPSNFVTSLCITDDKKIYAGTWKGIAVFKNDKWELIGKNQGLTDNITSLVFDKKNQCIYAGSMGFEGKGGISIIYKNGKVKFLKKSDGLASNNVTCITINPFTDEVWVGTWDAGISVLKSDGKIINYNTNNGLPSDRILCIKFDRFKRVWVGTKFYSGFAIYNGKEWKIYNEHNSGLINNAVHDITFSENGAWIGSWGGLDFIKFDVPIENFGEWEHFQVSSFQLLKGKTAFQLSSNFVRKIYYHTKTRSLWIGTDKGLSFFNQKDKWIVYTTCEKIVSSFDKDTLEWRVKKYPYKGLKSGEIFDILVAGDQVWIATDKGVGKFYFYKNRNLEGNT